jgi:2-oxoisovalerate dehydrogenase E2 component (dihydrolipoyl transacylase)
MARYQFRLPDVGEGVADAEIAAWHVSPGQPVAEDQKLIDVMTDKATVEISSPVSGTVVSINGAAGDRVPVGTLLVEFEVAPDTNIAAADSPSTAPTDSKSRGAPDASVNSSPESPPTQHRAVAPPPRTASIETRASQPPPKHEAPLAAPATRARAFKLGIPLQFVPASGPGGRITPHDLDDYIARGPRTAGAVAHSTRCPATAIHETKIIGLRRLIAERMEHAKRRIPHFSYIEEFDLTELEALRTELNASRSEQQPKLTPLPFFMLALVRLRAQFPAVNATYDDESQVLREYEAVHIGIASQSPGGLMVPVVRNAESLDFWSLARELARVTKAARDGKATLAELCGSTITLTSLGALGGIAATPVINAPEVAIIGPNKLVDRPVIRNGQLAFRTLMNLSTSFDHRIIDGHYAARFVQALRRLLERPALLFVQDS